jgi:hypothetical protein
MAGFEGHGFAARNLEVLEQKVLKCSMFTTNRNPNATNGNPEVTRRNPNVTNRNP